MDNLEIDEGDSENNDNFVKLDNNKLKDFIVTDPDDNINDDENNDIDFLDD